MLGRDGPTEVHWMCVCVGGGAGRSRCALQNLPSAAMSLTYKTRTEVSCCLYLSFFFSFFLLTCTTKEVAPPPYHICTAMLNFTLTPEGGLIVFKWALRQGKMERAQWQHPLQNQWVNGGECDVWERSSTLRSASAMALKGKWSTMTLLCSIATCWHFGI